jgi:hypothetical protein
MRWPARCTPRLPAVCCVGRLCSHRLTLPYRAVTESVALVAGAVASAACKGPAASMGACVRAWSGATLARPKQKARREHTLGRTDITSRSVVPPSLAAPRAMRGLPPRRARNACRRTGCAVVQTVRRVAGMRSMPCPVVTEGSRRVLLAVRRSSRVVAGQTPHAKPEGGFAEDSGAGLTLSPARCGLLRGYSSLATFVFGTPAVYALPVAPVKEPECTIARNWYMLKQVRHALCKRSRHRMTG